MSMLELFWLLNLVSWVVGIIIWKAMYPKKPRS